jgi:hypothetical protein
MKNLKSLLLVSFLPLFGFAQSLNGVYTGVLSNDSTTVRRDQSFEMALTEYNGKVYGYAYSTFIVNDTLYYIVKRVKGKVQGDICEVEDDEVISHNFPQKPEKKVFVKYTLRRNVSDSIWKLDGNWQTNLTKKYYAISGKVETKEEKDLSKSKLYEHLGDLDLQKTLAFNKPKEKAPEKKPVKGKENKDDIAKNTVKNEEKKNPKNADTRTDDKKPDASIAKADTKAPDNKTTSTAINDKKDIAANNTNAIDKKPDASNAKIDKKDTASKMVSVPVNNQQNPNEKKDIVSTKNAVVEKKPDVSVSKTDTKLPDNKPASSPVINQAAQNEKKDIPSTKANVVVKTESKPSDSKTVPATNPTTVKTDSRQPDNKLVSVPVGYQPTPNVAGTNNTTVDKKPETNIVKTDGKTTNAVQPTQNAKKDAAEKKPDGDFEFQELKRDRKLKPAASLVDGRVSVPSETIYFKSDSLSIAIYDNGEVDGDTVSVIINDEMFIQKQGLKSSAFRKTFYIPQTQSDSLLVVLYAENLGKYPPNTGLLQIKDGEEIFYVRFKADLNQNAAIVLRRKPR